MAIIPDKTRPQGGQPIVTKDRRDMRTWVDEAIRHFKASVLTVSDARNAFMGESDKAIGKRETLITDLANAAHVGHWSSDDLADIIKDTLKAHNASKGTVATFGAEIKRACARNVRGNVERWFALAREAFDAERALIAEAKAAGNKRPPTPLINAFSRHYHAVMAACKGERDFNSAADFVSYAEDTLRKRQLDYKRVKARLDAINRELAAFAKDFPVDGITACVEFLDVITTDELEKCVAPRVVDAEFLDDEPEADNERELAEGPVELEDVLEEDMTGLKAAAD